MAGYTQAELQQRLQALKKYAQQGMYRPVPLQGYQAAHIFSTQTLLREGELQTSSRAGRVLAVLSGVTAKSQGGTTLDFGISDPVSNGIMLPDVKTAALGSTQSAHANHMSSIQALTDAELNKIHDRYPEIFSQNQWEASFMGTPPAGVSEAEFNAKIFSALSEVRDFTDVMRFRLNGADASSRLALTASDVEARELAATYDNTFNPADKSAANSARARNILERHNRDLVNRGLTAQEREVLSRLQVVYDEAPYLMGLNPEQKGLKWGNASSFSEWAAKDSKTAEPIAKLLAKIRKLDPEFLNSHTGRLNLLAFATDPEGFSVQVAAEWLAAHGARAIPILRPFAPVIGGAAGILVMDWLNPTIAYSGTFDEVLMEKLTKLLGSEQNAHELVYGDYSKVAGVSLLADQRGAWGLRIVGVGPNGEAVDLKMSEYYAWKDRYKNISVSLRHFSSEETTVDALGKIKVDTSSNEGTAIITLNVAPAAITPTEGYIVINGQLANLSEIGGIATLSYSRESGLMGRVGKLINGIGNVISQSVHTIGGALKWVEEEIVDALDVSFDQIGSILASQLMRALPIEDPWTRMGVSTALGTTLSTFGRAIDLDRANGAGGSFSGALHEAFDHFDISLRDAGVGAVSSYLVGELVADLGIRNQLGQLTNSAGGAAISQISYNLLHASERIFVNAQGAYVGNVPANFSGSPPPGQSITTRAWNTQVGGAVTFAAASFIGSYLASRIVHFDTVGGQIGSAIGSTVGAIVGYKVGTKIGGEIGSIWGPIGTAIGAFIGFIIGGLFGSLFGGKKYPSSGAYMGYNETTQRFQISSTWSRHTSDAAARSMGDMITGLLNGVLEATGARVINPYAVSLGEIRQHKSDWYYAGAYMSTSAIPRVGGYRALSTLAPQLAGGDVYIKRALASTLVTTSESNFESQILLGNISTAQDYSNYLQNSAAINALIAAESQSAFAAGWLITFARVAELALNKRNSTDWVGGWNVFLDETFDGKIDGKAFTPANLGFEIDADTKERLFVFVDGAGDLVGTLGDTIDSAGKSIITGTASSDTINLSYGAFTRTRDVTTTVTLAAGARSFLSPADNTTFTIDASFTFAGAPITVFDAGGVKIVWKSAESIEVDYQRTTTQTGWRLDNAGSYSITEGGQSVNVYNAGYGIDIAALIDGGAGNDAIQASDQGDDVLGGEGNDDLAGGKLDDWLFGGVGNDRLFAGAVNFASVDLTTALNVNGGNGNLLDGGDGDDALYGATGSDWLKGGAGVDALYGGAGGDILEGGAGDDRGVSGEARILGGAGSDQYLFGLGDGNDVVFDESDPFGVANSSVDPVREQVLRINAGLQLKNWAGKGAYAQNGDVVGGEDAIVFGIGVGVENLRLRRSGAQASPGNDLIIDLVDAANVLTGDSLTVKDWFNLTRRVEWLRFADGEEIRIGALTAFSVGTGGADTIIGTYGNDFLVGLDGADDIRGLAGNDFGFGGKGDDLVAGDGDNDFVSGGTGADQVIGGAGNDTVFGDAGADDLYGGDGRDIVSGGAGDDWVAGGGGDDTFQFRRGDGRDTLIDDFVSNWEVVWQNGAYINGYVLGADGRVLKNGAVLFDGSAWTGRLDWNDSTKTLRRHLGAMNGAIAANSGNDTLEFAVGVDIQDLILRRNGGDLEIAIGADSDEARRFEEIGDRIAIKDWYATGAKIENFAFTEVGTINTASWNIVGGTDGADALTGAANANWITGGAGEDAIVGGAADDILLGGAGNDVVKGGAGADVLYGGEGADRLEGGAGADKLFGGVGEDTASYAGASVGVRADLGDTRFNTGEAQGDSYEGVEDIEGSNFVDQLRGDANANVLTGLGGDDLLMGGAGDDIYQLGLGSGADRIRESVTGIEQILDAAGNFDSAVFATEWVQIGTSGYTYSSSGVTYTIANYNVGYQLTVRKISTGEIVYQSRPAADFVYYVGPCTTTQPPASAPAASTWPFANGQWKNGFARSGSGLQTVRDAISGADNGADALALNSGLSLSDVSMRRLNGGADLEISISANDRVVIESQNDSKYAVETLVLSDGLAADLTKLVLAGETASAGDDFVIGDASANTLTGLAGDDVLSGGGGVDELQGGPGDDVLEGGAGADVLDGGTDSQTDGVALTSSDQAWGDTIRYVRSSAGVTIDLASGSAADGDAQGDVIVMASGVSTIEHAVGSEGFGDVISGDGRANRLWGLGGNDTLDGRVGDDVLIGGAGDDTLYGGDGEDNLSGEAGADRLFGGAGKDLLAGGDGVDSLQGEGGDDLLDGGAGEDILRGGAGRDTLGGGAGGDALYGDDGDDALVGGDGNDALYGGAGADTLAGEAGADRLEGGDGDDTYVFNATGDADVIVDAAGNNKIVLEGVSSQQVWLTRQGNNLAIGRIGESASSLIVENYFAATGASVVREIATQDASLFLKYAHPLIAAMGAVAASAPKDMPSEIAATLGQYWHAGGKAAPSVVASTYSVLQDGVLAGGVDAIDHDENIIGYALATAAAHGALSLDPATGAWTYQPASGFIGADSFEVNVTDADGAIARKSISVEVRDPAADVAPNAPVLTEQVLVSVDEGALNGGLVARLAATDPDGPAPALRVKAGSDPLGLFEIVNGNELRFKANASVTFAHAQSVSVEVESFDGLAASATSLRLAIAVDELNVAPQLPPATFSVSESAPGAGQTLVGTLDATDVNLTPAKRTMRYELIGGETGIFSIDQANGAIRVQGSLDFEAKRSYAVVARVWDGGAIGQGLSATSNVTINVDDVNEAPVITTVSSLRSISGWGYWGAYFNLGVDDPEGGQVSVRVDYVRADNSPFSSLAPQNVASGAVAPITYAWWWPYYSPGGKTRVTLSDSSGLTSVAYFDTSNGAVRKLPPVVLDLDGDGIELISGMQSNIAFDMDADGFAQPTGWVGGDDGLLVLDRNGDGLITDGRELAFRDDVDLAVSDLEGLRAYDSNQNGMIDMSDDRFADFRVWRDANQDGVSQTDELKMLSQHGIGAISTNLVTTGLSGDFGADNVIYGYVDVLHTDQTITQAADVYLSYLQAQPVDFASLPAETSAILEAAAAELSAINLLPPIVLDLDGDGLDLISRSGSSVFFDVLNNGVLQRTGWVGAGDGILALDRDGDGRITNGAEISFVADLDGAVTDLEGLAAFDTNLNGYFDIWDVRAGDFLIWRDLNQDGVSESGETQTLAQAGVGGIALTRTAAAVNSSGATDNVVVAQSQFIRMDGSVGLVGDVMLAFGEDPPPASSEGDAEPTVGVDRQADGGSSAVDRATRARQLAGAAIDAADSVSAGAAFDSGKSKRKALDLSSPKEASQPSADKERNEKRKSLFDKIAASVAGGAKSDEDRFATTLAASHGGEPARTPAIEETNLADFEARRRRAIEAMAQFEPKSGADPLGVKPKQKELDLLTSLPDIAKRKIG